MLSKKYLRFSSNFLFKLVQIHKWDIIQIEVLSGFHYLFCHEKKIKSHIISAYLLNLDFERKDLKKIAWHCIKFSASTLRNQLIYLMNVLVHTQILPMFTFLSLWILGSSENGKCFLRYVLKMSLCSSKQPQSTLA